MNTNINKGTREGEERPDTNIVYRADLQTYKPINIEIDIYLNIIKSLDTPNDNMTFTIITCI